uniref:Virulence protein RhuM family protein n=1 Tax=Candidatus Kentrum sp. SD TaxID=2126332 RepID=A0A450YAR8_9GAMM|nr:MAG: Virulence protein RhuM family protein [Candidatus Kentron sp. SD]VFK44165.1 MAG: Virulence protein RhuM family protein [Candidatus Kentron sp. SD]VFK77891.1 MAG: Virulence protein RhuM family protein [Candidatus Kentron sp. SD]
MEECSSRKILKSDVKVAKNYLDRDRIKELERIVSACLDLAENRAERGIVMRMIDWVKFPDSFLELSSYPILDNRGKISAEMAKAKAIMEYDKFRVIQDKSFESDFDRKVKKMFRI